MEICWYCPENVTKDFNDPLDNPSFRLRTWYNHNYLLKEGYNSRIVHNIYQIGNPDILILMSFGEEEYNLTKWLKKHKKIVIHDYTEDIRGIPILEQTKEMCDLIVCCSTELAQKEEEVYKEKVKVIKDPAEPFPISKNTNHENFRLKVCWSGMGGNAEWVYNLLQPIVDHLDMDYIEISNRPEATIPWNRETWYFYMATCDICICPQVHWEFPAKSNVKVTTALSLGLPVVASPITSYKEIIKNGENGFIANSLEEWLDYLHQLRSKQKRIEFVRKSKPFLEQYTVEHIYNQWKNIFKRAIK